MRNHKVLFLQIPGGTRHVQTGQSLAMISLKFGLALLYVVINVIGVVL